MDSSRVSVAVDQVSPQTQAFYLQDGQPSTTASMTDKSGVGGFVNLPTGARRFTTQLADTRRPIGEITGYVRPATLLIAKIGPALTR